jgi:transposase InsO family protein
VAWDEVKQTVSFRKELMALAAHEGANVRELCRRFQVSPKTFYKWWKRSRSEGTAGLVNRSRRPHESPGRTEPEVEEQILKIRETYPSWGARKIRRIMVNERAPEIPADSTIHRILQRHGKVDPKESSKHQPWQRFEHEAPNDLWQIDFKGWFRTGNQQRCNPLTILDDHSRYVVCLQACQDQQTETVQTQLTATFRRYGLPERMTMDNGSPWGNDAEHRYTPLTAWLIRLGIRISHSRPFHPQTQGKDERFHRTLDVDLLRWHRFSNIHQVQKRFDEYRHIYNQKRPHQALGLDVPASRYRVSARSFPETLPAIAYDANDIVRKVQIGGHISFKGRPFLIAKAFCGYPVALRPTTDDGVFAVYFCGEQIRQIDLQNL